MPPWFGTIGRVVTLLVTIERGDMAQVLDVALLAFVVLAPVAGWNSSEPVFDNGASFSPLAFSERKECDNFGSWVLAFSEGSSLGSAV